MGRKASKDPQEWLAYHSRLMALTLPPTYVDKVQEALPEKKIARIKNARNGLVLDMDVLDVLERLSNEERGRRSGAAYLQTANA